MVKKFDVLKCIKSSCISNSMFNSERFKFKGRLPTIKFKINICLGETFGY